MAISNDLFLAILAMDSYNRGYNAGLGDPETGLPGTQIGNAVLGISDQSTAAKAASFFAQSYTWNGQTIISYRGTDNFDPLNGDPYYGWPMGGGFYSVERDRGARP